MLDYSGYDTICKSIGQTIESGARTVLEDSNFLTDLSAELSESLHILFNAHRVNGVQQILHALSQKAFASAAED